MGTKKKQKLEKKEPKVTKIASSETILGFSAYLFSPIATKRVFRNEGVELRPFDCNKRMSVPMSYISLAFVKKSAEYFGHITTNRLPRRIYK